jgi:hypothetical protein
MFRVRTSSGRSPPSTNRRRPPAVALRIVPLEPPGRGLPGLRRAGERLRADDGEHFVFGVGLRALDVLEEPSELRKLVGPLAAEPQPAVAGIAVNPRGLESRSAVVAGAERLEDSPADLLVLPLRRLGARPVLVRAIAGTIRAPFLVAAVRAVRGAAPEPLRSQHDRGSRSSRVRSSPRRAQPGPPSPRTGPNRVRSCPPRRMQPYAG